MKIKAMLHKNLRKRLGISKENCWIIIQYIPFPLRRSIRLGPATVGMVCRIASRQGYVHLVEVELILRLDLTRRCDKLLVNDLVSPRKYTKGRFCKGLKTYFPLIH